MTRRLICIIGTDGSGKTTLAEAVAAALTARGQPARVVWLGAESRLMAPVRGLLRLVWAGRGNRRGAASQRVDYAAEIARKAALAARHPRAVRIYLALVRADYRMQLAFKRWRHRATRTIVADRYAFDVAVNLGLTLGWDPDRVVRFVQRRLAGLALPQVRIFLRTAPEVALARKSDIFDIDYLRLRLRYYEAIARAFGFTVLDGSLPAGAARDRVLAEIDAEAARPHVLYVHANNTDIGGADRVLALMARRMRDHGCRVTVALRLPTAIVDSHAGAGIPVILHRFVRPQVSRGAAGLIGLALAAPGSLWFFWRLFRRERPDIVHANDLYDILPVLAARLAGIPAVWHVRMIPASARLARVLDAVLTRLPAKVVFVSQATARAFPGAAARHGAVLCDFADARLTATPPPDSPLPDAPAPRPAPLPDGGRLVVMLGRVEPWKGQHVFLEAVAALPAAIRAGHVFALAGGAVPGKEDYFATVAEKARGLGLHVLGARSDVPDILRAADVSVHCSVAPEPLGAVVLESLLAGAATVATAHGGVPEIIVAPDQGILVPPGDAAALGAVLAGLLDDPAPPRRRFARAGRARALEMTDSGRIAAELAKIYRSLPPASNGDPA